MSIVQDYAAWLSASDVPKLFINADPLILRVGDFYPAAPENEEDNILKLPLYDESNVHLDV